MNRIRMGVSLQKVAGLSVVLKVALSNTNSGKMGQNSGKQSIYINGSALCGLILQQFTLQRDVPICPIDVRTPEVGLGRNITE